MLLKCDANDFHIQDPFVYKEVISKCMNLEKTT